jgi:alkylated DNA nucleotide flippase Atl1
MGRKKTFREKLDGVGESKVVANPRGGGKLLIPTPREVDEVVRRVRRGKVLTLGRLREHLARKHGAETTCPLCTGIFINIVAGAAEEESRAGVESVAPWWRVVRDDGSLNPKFPGGIAEQERRLAAEGVDFVRTKSGAPRVADVESRLQRL